METIKLSFEAKILGSGKEISFEIPYSEGIVATSRFCPLELLNSNVELLAALNGESLESFVKDCKMQLEFANEVYPQLRSLHESFIAGLIASVLEHKRRSSQLSMKDFLLHVDAFSYLQFASGVSEEQIIRMYPKILDTVIQTLKDQTM